MPIEGEYEFVTDDKTFVGAREAGPFATQPEISNASAVYVGRGQGFALSGNGVMICFSAKAHADKPASFVKAGDRRQDARGAIRLVSPEDITTNIVAGETYVGPGACSQIPNVGGDCEALCYHVLRPGDDSCAVRVLTHEDGLKQSYVLDGDDAVAIPGAQSFLAAGPASDVVCLWAMASDKTLKPTELDTSTALEEVIDILTAEREPFTVSCDKLATLADGHKLSMHQREMLRLRLLGRGFRIE